VLELADLVVDAGGRRVVDGARLQVVTGEVVLLVGPDGSGPSTLLATVAGLAAPTAGQIRLLGVDVTSRSVTARAAAGMAAVFERWPTLAPLTVADNLRLAGARVRHHDPDFVRAAQHRVLELFPVLGDRFGDVAGRLPGADQRLLGLAQALLGRPRLIVTDELFAGRSAPEVDELAAVVRSLATGGVTFVMAEPSVGRATTAATRLVVMEEGRLVESGPPTGLDVQAAQLRADLHRAVGRVPGPAPVPAKRPGPVELGSSSAEPVAGASLVVSTVSVSRAGVERLDDVDFDVALGEVLGVLGPDGAGKTLLLDVCSGFVRPTRGRVTLDGRDVTDVGPGDRAGLGLGRVFQRPGLWPGMTVAQALAAAAGGPVTAGHLLAGALDLASVERAEAEVTLAVDELLDLMALRPVADVRLGRLPLAIRRRVDLAGALALRPRVLLLDEPAAGLARSEAEALTELVAATVARTGTTTLVAGRDVALVASMADRALCLDQGRVVAQGPTAQVLDHPAVVRAYLGRSDADRARSDPRAAATP
jgi:branched-chain amino acid transport system ATP-binding protein